MKIVNENDDRFWDPLETYKGGTPVVFKHSFHQKFDDGDLFVVNSVNHSYRPADPKYNGKISVTHVKTGEISYLEKTRDCRVANAHVVIQREISHG